MEEQKTAELPGWFADVFEAVGSDFVEKEGKVAADTPWGSGYMPTRFADMNATQREDATKMYDRWEQDDNFVTTDSPDGTKNYTDKTSGFTANSDQLMLTANAEGKYEVASMFDIGMYTGAVAEARQEMIIQNAIRGEDTSTPTEGDDTGKPLAGDKPSSNTESPNLAEEMLKTDLDNDTSMVGEAEAPTASLDNISYKSANVDIQASPKTHDMVALSKDTEVVPAKVLKALEMLKLDATNPAYNATKEALTDKFMEQVASHHSLVKPEEPKPKEEQGQYEAPAKRDSSLHWVNTGVEDSKGADSKYERKYSNEYGKNENYGNYSDRAEWKADWDYTLTQLQTGKGGVKSEQLKDNMLNNERLYHDLGIATAVQIDNYEADKKLYYSDAKTRNSVGGRKLSRQDQIKASRAEVTAELDNYVDANPDKPVLGQLKVNKQQIRSFNRNKDASTTMNKEQTTRVANLRTGAARISHMQKLMVNANLEAMEKVSPKERATVFIKKFFGGSNDKELNTVLLGMAKDEMVSRVVKEISGAAASDQERTFIKQWLLGADGASSQQFISTINSIQGKLYKQAQALGDELYTEDKVGGLWKLQEATKSIAKLPEAKAIKKVN